MNFYGTQNLSSESFFDRAFKDSNSESRQLLGKQRTKDTKTKEDSWSLLRSIKVFLLVLCCLFATVILLFMSEKEIDCKLLTVEHNSNFVFSLNMTSETITTLLSLTLVGPFLSPNYNSFSTTHIFVKSFTENGSLGNSHQFPIYTENSNEAQLVNIKQSKQILLFKSRDDDDNTRKNDLSYITISSNSPDAISLVFCNFFPSYLTLYSVHFGALILLGMYGLIIFDVIHRTVAALLGATITIGTLALLRERPSFNEIITWLDVETLVLLFSMMIIVSILSETGVFTYAGFKAYTITKGQTWHLFFILCTVSALTSAFLDNVTTILLLSPVVIQLCETLRMSVIPVLISVTIMSNIGGAATAIGDPPNVLIASNSVISQSVSFGTFALHMMIPIGVIGIASAFLLSYMIKINNEEIRYVDELKNEITIWELIYEKLPTLTREERIVQESLRDKISTLRTKVKELNVKITSQTPYSDSDWFQKLQRESQITNKGLLIKASIVLLFTILLFFVGNVQNMNLTMGWTACLGALTLLLLTDRAEAEGIFEKVEWTTLIFFASLFVLMEGLSKLGLLDAIGQGIESLIRQVPSSYQLAVSLLLILWVSGLASAFIDNIPFTTMMIPVIINLSESLSLPLQPLVWSLSLGACLGGNGTLIGASANLICAGVSEQHGYKISFNDFFKIGFPIMIFSLTLSSIYLLICHVALNWNQ